MIADRVKCLLMALLLVFSLEGRAQSGAERPIIRSTLYGVGCTNLYDTYLSPLEYQGAHLRVVRESCRLTPWLDGNVSRQVLFQGNLAMADNPAETANELAGMLNWNYALHYRFSFLGDRIRLLVGPMWQLHGGFIYNTRNGNNPAQARLYTNLAASAMVHYTIPWQRCPIALRYQVDFPFFGVMFSPQYGQSYYEIFSLGHTDGVVRCTSLRQQPSMRHWLTADIKFRRLTLRLGYMADFQQSCVNNLRTHDYSHSFLIGLVKKLVVSE